MNCFAEPILKREFVFGKVFFGMLKLDTSQPVLSEAAFIVQLERLFPKAIILLKSGKSKSDEKHKNAAKSVGEKTVGISSDQIPDSSAAPFSLILDDVSIIGIRLLEWMDVLQSKSVSLKKYISVQTTVLENKRVLSESNTSQGKSSSGLVKQPKKDTIQSTETSDLSVNKEFYSEKNADSVVGKTEEQAGDTELNLKKPTVEKQ